MCLVAGIVLGCVRAILWGLMAPSLLEFSGPVLLSWLAGLVLVLLEGEGYVLAMLASYLHGRAWLLPARVGADGPHLSVGGRIPGGCRHLRGGPVVIPRAWKGSGSMDKETTFRITFWALLTGVLAVRIYSARRIRSAGEREGRGMFAGRVMAFLLLLAILVLYTLSPSCMAAFTAPFPGWLRWTGLGLGGLSLLLSARGGNRRPTTPLMTSPAVT